MGSLILWKGVNLALDSEVEALLTGELWTKVGDLVARKLILRFQLSSLSFLSSRSMIWRIYWFSCSSFCTFDLFVVSRELILTIVPINGSGTSSAESEFELWRILLGVTGEGKSFPKSVQQDHGGSCLCHVDSGVGSDCSSLHHDALLDHV